MEPTPTALWYLMGESLALTYRAAPQLEAWLTPHAALILSGEPVADLNYALLDQSPDAETHLRAFHQRSIARQLPTIFLLSDQATTQLRPLVAELGLEAAGSMPIMVAAHDAPASTASDYRIEQIDDERQLTQVWRIAAHAYNIPQESLRRAWGPLILAGPGVAVFLAWRGGEAVSTLQTTRAGKTVGIWAMATEPAYQRQGAGRALLGTVMRRHIAQGCESFYLGASAAGKVLYERLGFRTVGEASVWLNGGTGHPTEH